ncbi:MAG: hypothetical protein KIS82_11970 [Ferruginibacter sp.]|nr:hypothetical protein [Ferruginibacter sp.]
MKYLLALAFGTLVCNLLFSQSLSRTGFKALQQKEDSMIPLSWRIVQGINTSDRFEADSQFTRIFVRALAVQNSFEFPFDSLQTISKIYPPDSSFRIFTWQLLVNENLVRQHGAIQMKTSDGSLKLFPLIDKSDVTENPEDTIADNFGWIGAVYYKVIEKEYKGKPYYTLLGYDENNIRSTKKIVEVLHFENGKPEFGGHFFSIPNNNALPRNPARYVIEFKKDASPRLNYDPELDLIVMEHLVSESNQPQKKWTLIPDGDYEALKWRNGKWVYIDKIFNQVTPEGKAPVPNPYGESKLKPNAEN